MKSTYLLLVLLSSPFFPANAQESNMHDLYPCVAIHFDTTHPFPDKWYAPKIDAQTIPVDSTEIPFVTYTLHSAFQKYPETLLCKELQRVYIFKKMRFYQVSYGGTSYGKTVYITLDNDNFNCSYDQLEDYFHHEFSSVLLKNNRSKFEKRKWMKNNPTGFRYGKGGLYAIQTNTAEMQFEPQLNELGFLTRYSQASLEEDFNVICQNLFNGGPEFWRIVDTYPLIKAKVGLAVNFFLRLDGRLTEGYFRGCGIRDTGYGIRDAGYGIRDVR